MKLNKVTTLNFSMIIIYLLLAAVLLNACQEKNALPDPLTAGWKGKAVCEVLDENDKMRTLKCTFPPGVGHERHYHPPHFWYTLVGSTFRITDAKGTREVNVKTGSHFSKDTESSHEVVNIGDSTAVFLIMEPK